MVLFITSRGLNIVTEVTFPHRCPSTWGNFLEFTNSGPCNKDEQSNLKVKFHPLPFILIAFIFVYSSILVASRPVFLRRTRWLPQWYWLSFAELGFISSLQYLLSKINTTLDRIIVISCLFRAGISTPCPHLLILPLEKKWLTIELLYEGVQAGMFA